ncbi:uncharacterized protein LOC115668179 [Syzygium oleosum]|uniref:uncharacterized protein LOC115668179 n=1 Tax=Syzygium oleosum TaxID=219896 RepID=UPI0011D2523D|nr:uncharacterized protein LOC115668179 [Syzygium oleosum]
MSWRKECLDVILVPIGLLIMSGYHLFLLYRCLKFPQTTVIGYENHCRKVWVERMLQIEAKERGMSLTVISTTLSAATFLASTSLALSSLIGAWIGSSSHSVFTADFIYGDTSPSMISVKYISLLSCFLVAFGSFLQCVRSSVHAIFLMSMPNSDIPVAYVQKAVITASIFWSVGLRAIYFAINLLLWIFGPIPMLICSVTMVVVLHNLDTNSTALHNFQPKKDLNLLSKMGHGVSDIMRGVEHPENVQGAKGTGSASTG